MRVTGAVIANPERAAFTAANVDEDDVHVNQVASVVTERVVGQVQLEPATVLDVVRVGDIGLLDGKGHAVVGAAGAAIVAVLARNEKTGEALWFRREAHVRREQRLGDMLAYVEPTGVGRFARHGIGLALLIGAEGVFVDETIRLLIGEQGSS